MLFFSGRAQGSAIMGSFLILAVDGGVGLTESSDWLNVLPCYFKLKAQL